jgi:CheY-like chemotaxis protein
MKIMVIDDEPDMKALFEQKFRKEVRSGKVVFTFAICAEDALQYLEAYKHEAILILSDINMPGMSGLELLSEIKHGHYTPPPVVMMITAYGDADNYRHAMELGADDFLTKPLDFTLLKEKLNIG